MTTFVSGGHHQKDSGAVSPDGKRTEFKEMAKFRDKVVDYLRLFHKDIKVVVDKDFETLGQYLTRVQTGSSSVVCEFHLDAFSTPTANGCTVITKDNPDQKTLDCANEILNAVHEITGIRKRGVIGESKSNRGRLGLMRESGIVVLVELGFITNECDMRMLDHHENHLARKIADILAKYDRLY